MTTFVHFSIGPNSRSGKTKTWIVLTKARDSYLGEIKWHSPWRRYVFIPAKTSLFDPDCLKDIAAFTSNATKNHKMESKV